MLEFQKALRIMTSVEPRMGIEHVALGDCLGRVVAEPVHARIAIPPFSKSAMDGFAISSDDASEDFLIGETIPAGSVPGKSVTAGTCARIMTGAMMPEGADAVVRVEYVEESKGRVRIVTAEKGSNVILSGENVSPGEPVFEPGMVEPKNIGIFAEQGIDRLPVRVPPTVGVIATGSELKDTGEVLEPGSIYNSNGPQLCAQIAAIGCKYRYHGIVEDSGERLVEALERAGESCDVVVLSGGVSMGDFDFVPKAVEQTGAEILFHKVAVKPGKPLLFARGDTAHYVGLPGNPVSTFIIFEVMIKPMLYRLMGIAYEPPSTPGRLADDISRRDASRHEFRPVFLSRGDIRSVSYHGSSHLRALASANALLTMEVGVEKMTGGTQVYVRSF